MLNKENTNKSLEVAPDTNQGKKVWFMTIHVEIAERQQT